MHAKLSMLSARGAAHLGRLALMVGAFALVGAGCEDPEEFESEELAVDEEEEAWEFRQLPAPWPPNPALQLDVNFESGTVSPLGQEIEGAGTITVIRNFGTASTAPNSGAYSAKMMLSGAKTHRAELKSSSGGKLDYDSEYWLGFAFRVETWGQSDWAMLFQTHAVPSTWDCTSGRNPISISMSKDGKLGLNVINDPKATAASGGAGGPVVWKAANPVTLNAWQRWVIRIKPSAKSTGVVQAWLNGSLIYERTGANVDALDTCGLPQDDWIYTKFGLYKSYSNTNTQRVVYDDIRILKGTNGYNTVRPPGLPAK